MDAAQVERVRGFIARSSPQWAVTATHMYGNLWTTRARMRLRVRWSRLASALCALCAVAGHSGLGRCGETTRFGCTLGSALQCEDSAAAVRRSIWASVAHHAVRAYRRQRGRQLLTDSVLRGLEAIGAVARETTSERLWPQAAHLPAE